MNNCEGCQYWSEMVAESIGCGPIKAMCLNDESGHYNKMVNHGCDNYRAGYAIDMPTP